MGQKNTLLSRPGVYAILNAVTGVRYVGGTTAALSTRFAEHRFGLRRGIHGNGPMQTAWDKDGESMFTFLVIETCARDEVHRREQHWCDKFLKKGFPLYNIRIIDVTKQTGLHHSAETKAKLAKALTGKPHNVSPEGRKILREIPKGNSYGKANAKPFSLIAPSGETAEGINLNEFAAAHGLDFSALAKVHAGARPSHKGYTNPDARAAYLADHPFRRAPSVEKTCPECGTVFAVPHSSAPRRVYCSHACRNRADATKYAGAGNPNYRHGLRVVPR